MLTAGEKRDKRRPKGKTTWPIAARSTVRADVSAVIILIKADLAGLLERSVIVGTNMLNLWSKNLIELEPMKPSWRVR